VTLQCTSCGATLRREVWAGLPRTDMTPDQLEHYARWYGWADGLCPDCSPVRQGSAKVRPDLEDRPA
jgi:hypothetical protein